MKNKSKLYYLLLFKDTAWLIKKIKFSLYYRDALVIRVKYNFKRLIDDWKIKYISDNYNYPHHIVFIAGLPSNCNNLGKNNVCTGSRILYPFLHLCLMKLL